MTTNSVANSDAKMMAVAALVSGIASLLILVIYLLSPTGAVLLYIGLALGVFGVILGSVSLKRKQSKGFALTGLITGAVGVLLALGIIIFALIFVGAFMA